MGRVIAPFGVVGWIKIQTFTEAIESLSHYPVWWIAKDSRWIDKRVLESKVHGRVLTARLQGCDDRDAAQLLNGYEIAVPRSEFPPSLEGEYYWADLIGVKVVNRENAEFGEVAGLLETGANCVLKISGERERLIPFVDQVIVEVNLTRRRMIVDWDTDF